MNQVKRGLFLSFVSLSLAGMVALKQDEGLRTNAYLDVVGVPTICYGSTRGVRIGESRSVQECDNLLRLEAGEVGKALGRCVTAEVSQKQYDVLVNFAYNVGWPRTCRSTLVRKLNAGDCLGASKEFLRWDKAAGRPLKALKSRRLRDSTEFASDCLKEPV